MPKHLIDMLQDIIEAEETAKHLRDIYGRDAEAHCDELNGARESIAEDRIYIDDVRRALRWC